MIPEPSISPGNLHFPLAVGTRQDFHGGVMQIIPCKTGRVLEIVFGRLSRDKVECGRVDASVHRLPWEARRPETQLGIADTILKEGSWVEHVCVPNHKYICKDLY